jgi:hypothetical protein
VAAAFGRGGNVKAAFGIPHEVTHGERVELYSLTKAALRAGGG